MSNDFHNGYRPYYPHFREVPRRIGFNPAGTLVTKKNFEEVLKIASESSAASFDVETTSLDFTTCSLVTINLSYPDNRNYVAFYNKSYFGEHRDKLPTNEQIDELIHTTLKRDRVYAHNRFYDQHVLMNTRGFKEEDFWGVHDTLTLFWMCPSSNEFVLTKRGYQRIKNLTHPLIGVNLLKQTHQVSFEQAPGYRIHLSDGRYMECSVHHPILSYCGNLVVTKLSDDLCPGDFIASSYIPYNGTNSPVYKGKSLNRNFVSILGFMYKSAYFISDTLVVPIPLSYKLPKFLPFDSQLGYNTSQDNYLLIKDPDFIKWIEEKGFIDTIPDEVYSYSKDLLDSYLSSIIDNYGALNDNGDFYFKARGSFNELATLLKIRGFYTQLHSDLGVLEARRPADFRPEYYNSFFNGNKIKQHKHQIKAFHPEAIILTDLNKIDEYYEKIVITRIEKLRTLEIARLETSTHWYFTPAALRNIS